MKQSERPELNDSAWNFTIPNFVVSLPFHLPKYSLTTYLFIFIIAGFLINQALLMKINSSMVSPPLTLSTFDQSMVAKLKNEGKSYPILGTAHNHANMKVFVNGQLLNFAKPEYYMKSRFLHVNNNQNLEDASSVLHMHAKNVPMAWFFESLGMQLGKDSLTLADGQVLRNGNGNTLKFFRSGKKVDELGNYVFQPLGKILISFGPENDPDIQRQIDSVPNFAKDHQK